jgi:hypothetical protein
MKKIHFLVWVVALMLVAGCADHEFSSVARDGDYLPTDQTDRYFLREQFTHPDLSNRFYNDTIRVAFAGDVVLNNKVYQKFELYSMWDSGSGMFESRNVYRYFRKEGARYMEPAEYPEAEEHVFLDIEKPVGSSWHYFGGFEKETKTTYIIKAVNATRRINGTDYKDVIEVEMETQVRDYNGSYYRLMTCTRYFARGKGEVYSLTSFFVYTLSTRISPLE